MLAGLRFRPRQSLGPDARLPSAPGCRRMLPRCAQKNAAFRWGPFGLRCSVAFATPPPPSSASYAGWHERLHPDSTSATSALSLFSPPPMRRGHAAAPVSTAPDAFQFSRPCPAGRRAVSPDTSSRSSSTRRPLRLTTATPRFSAATRAAFRAMLRQATPNAPEPETPASSGGMRWR